jgi:hypothetical protein
LSLTLVTIGLIFIALGSWLFIHPRLSYAISRFSESSAKRLLSLIGSTPQTDLYEFQRVIQRWTLPIVTIVVGLVAITMGFGAF